MNLIRFSLFLILTIFVFSFGGCQKKGTDTPPSEVPHPDLSSEPGYPLGEGPLKLKAEAVGLESPHQYRVKLGWTAENLEPSAFFLVQRHDWNEGRIVPEGQSFYLDESVGEGQEYFYQVRMLNGSKTTSSDRIKISIPRDKVFEEGEHILGSPIEGYHRIFFSEGAKMFWQGEKIEIKTHDIISENAVFESFTEDQKKAPVGRDGKSGGHLTIDAKSLKGKIFIRADGQNGGRGVTGSPGKNGETGEQGPTAFLYWGNHRKVPPGAYIYEGHWFQCDPPRLPGGKGKPGETGGKGMRGGKGGNSGKVFLSINKMNEGEVFFTNKPGAGGEEGLGGPGGEGGPGGNPGPIDWQTHASLMPQGANLELFHQCAPLPGEKGDSGAEGPLGERGEDGFQAPYCLKLGDSKTGQCD